MRKLVLTVAVLAMCTVARAGEISLKAYVPTNPTAVPTKALTRFAERVNEAGKGKVNIKVFHSGQLGNDREAVESTRMGTIDIMFSGTGTYSAFYEKAKLLDLPYLFENGTQAMNVVNGPIGEELFADLKDFGLVYLSTGDNGMRHVSTTNRKINAVDDVKGLKIRVPATDMYVDIWKYWGGMVVPTPIGELYMALKTGTVEAQDNAPYHSVASKVYEVLNHFSLINYAWMGLTMTANQRAWDRLPADVQALIKREAVEAAKWSFEEIARDDQAALKLMAEKGMEINYTPDIESFRKTMPAFYKQFEKDAWFNQAIIDQIRSGK